jgi:hypothetical protein
MTRRNRAEKRAPMLALENWKVLLFAQVKATGHYSVSKVAADQHAFTASVLGQPK